MTDWLEQGSGAALTLLHGISSGAAAWHKQLALPGCRVVAWEMPGYGVSPPLTQEKALAGDYAQALAALLDRQGVQRTVLVGHSLGALVAAAFAARFPERVIALVLADPAQGYGAADAERREQVWRSREQQIALGGETLAQTRAARLLRPDASAEDIATVASGMRRLRAEGFLAAAWMLAHDDIHRWLSRWNKPFEVWCGEQDSITPPAQARALAQRYGMRCRLISDAGHASYLDNAAQFNQQLLRVMEEVRNEGTD
ncbi:3-oxoadipate enol-lactonase 2 [Mixta theicola]|nr:alpha/beta hydrolase [Mixta theicola]QHM74289.1 3-oxoadipate enol-lactonase 2 [Mixta theicola]